MVPGEKTMNEMPEEERLMREEVAREVYGGEATVDDQVENEVVEEKEEVVDAWAGVNPALRQTLESLQSRISDLDVINNRLKQAESRVGGMERRIHEVTKPVEKTAEKEAVKALESTEAWKSLDDYDPDLVEPIRKALINEITSKIAEIEGRIPDVGKVKEDFESKLDEITKKVEIRMVDRAHKDWREIVKTDEYHTFLSQLPPQEAAKANSWSADDAIDLIDKFKEHRSSKKSVSDIAAERERRLNSAAADNRKSGKPIKTKSEDDMTDDEYRAYVAKQIFNKR